MSRRLLGLFVIGYWLIVNAFGCVYAEEVTILFTGQTHAMLYPCDCPYEQDGGVARRASKIREFRKADPHILLLDAGNFFAGGLMDEYSQNTELDKVRTFVNLNAIKLMGYDALCISDDEFNFGAEFFEAQTANLGIPLLSCNIRGSKMPFITKEVKGIAFGIIGVTTPLAKSKVGILDIASPAAAVKDAVSSLKGSGADVIVLLSTLSSDENMQLMGEIPTIDIIIGNFTSVENKEPFLKKNNTVVFRPFFQGRRLSKATLFIKNKKIDEIDFEEIRLSDEIKDDKDMVVMLPRCFSDDECRKENLVGYCQNPGRNDAVCTYAETKRVNLYVIEPPDCKTCSTKAVINNLKKTFPGLTVSYIKYPSSQSKEMIDAIDIDSLPAYILGKEAGKEKEFPSFRDNVYQRGDFYLVKPSLGGVSLYLKRQKVEGQFDIFISLFDRDAAELLAMLREFNPTVHFLTVESDKGFQAKSGVAEAEEYVRSVCVQKYYPQDFWNYIICRADRTSSSWWEDCCSDAIDTEVIRECARSKEGDELLKENISLNKEIQVMFGPTYLINNNEIFSSKGVPLREEIRKIIKKK